MNKKNYAISGLGEVTENTTVIESELMRTVLEFSQKEQEKGNKNVRNLRNKFALRHSLRMAEEIARYLPYKGKILDWGCGYGHMTFFMANLGLRVISCDVHCAALIFLEKIGFQNFVRIGTVSMPFKDASFDAVLSCGVFEHVADYHKSLLEINKVLVKQGWLFIYMLPHKYGLYELIASILKKSDHPVKYTLHSIRKILVEHGFEVVVFRRGNLFPKNLVLMPGFILKFLEKIYNNNYAACIFLEKMLLRIPIVNMLSGTLEIIARKKRET